MSDLKQTPNKDSKTSHTVKPVHDEFQLGHGYGSGEKSSEAETHASLKQYRDNPLPKSGGNYAKADEVQPNEESETPAPTRKLHHP